MTKFQYNPIKFVLYKNFSEKILDALRKYFTTKINQITRTVLDNECPVYLKLCALCIRGTSSHKHVYRVAPVLKIIFLRLHVYT